MRIASGITLLTALLTLVAAPAACSGGVLAHRCAPEEVDHGADYHEDSCPSDPCNQDSLAVAVRSTADDDFPDVSSSPVILPARLVPSGRQAAATDTGDLLLRAPANYGARSLPLLC